MITDGQLLAVAELRTVLHWLETGSGLVACVLSAIIRASESALDWLRVSCQRSDGPVMWLCWSGAREEKCAGYDAAERACGRVWRSDPS